MAGEVLLGLLDENAGPGQPQVPQRGLDGSQKELGTSQHVVHDQVATVSVHVVHHRDIVELEGRKEEGEGGEERLQAINERGRH